MARPLKTGLDYFPFDVDFFDDEKIEAIAGEFGIKGELAAVKLLCAVYRNGYFARWDELLKMKLLKRLPGTSAELLEQIVHRLVKWGFFDEKLFHSAKVLTSRGIQRRYLEAVKRRKEDAITVYVCTNEVSEDNNLEQSVDNASENAESKGKEIKEEESKEWQAARAAASANGSGKKKKKDAPPREIVFPWDTPAFREMWEHWKEYKRLEFRFGYKSPQSEQSELTELCNMARGDEMTALAIIQKSMSKGWKGLFALDNNDGKSNTNGPRPAGTGGPNANHKLKLAERMAGLAG